MTQPTDIQSAVVAELLERLAAVPDFGASVTEDFVLRVIDSDDETLPDYLIVIQPGSTEEVERVGVAGVRESFTLTITLLTRRRSFGPELRAGRLAVKELLAGTKAGLTVQGVTSVKFDPDSLAPAGEGRRWSGRAMPLQINYHQALR